MIEINKKGCTCFKSKPEADPKMIANFTIKRLGVGKIAKKSKEDELEENDYWLIEFKAINNKAVEVCIPVEIFSDLKKFKEFANKREGSFTGTTRELDDWIGYIMNENTIDRTDFYLIKDHYGRWKIGEKDIWIFKNGFYLDGEFRAGKDFYEYEKNKAVKMEINQYKSMAPEFDEKIKGKVEIEDLQDIFSCLEKFFGTNIIVVYLIIAFYASSLRYSDFFEALNIQKHPILQVAGRTSSGKTEFFTGLVAMLIGMQKADFGSWYATSPFVIEKSLSLISHYPLLLDEYRESKLDRGTEKRKQELLRSAFNRTPIKKGTANLDLVGFDVLSTLIILGEDSPNDPAIKNRCISVVMGSDDKVSKDEWRRIKREAKDWFKFFIYVANAGIDKELVKNDYDYFSKRIKSDNRSADNYCYLLTVYSSLFLLDPETRDIAMSELSEMVNVYLGKKSDDLSDTSNLNDFVEACLTIVAKQKTLYLHDYIKVEDGYIYLWISGLYRIFGPNDYAGLLSESAIKNMLQKEHGAEGRCSSRINGLSRSCHRVDLDDAPGCLVDLEEYLKEEIAKRDEEENKHSLAF